MEYLVLIHNNSKTPANQAEWTEFVTRAKDTGMFRGGSELGTRELIGRVDAVQSSTHIGGFMRFDSNDKARLLELLEFLPVVSHGGTIELCEMPKS